jgi:hypothetical protein
VPQLVYFPGIAYAPDGRSVIVVYPPDLSPDELDEALDTEGRKAAPVLLRRYDARTGSPLGKPVRVAPRPGPWALLPGPRGRLVYASDSRTYLIDAGTLRVVRRYPVGSKGYTAAISADGNTLALGEISGTVRLLDLASGRVREVRGRHDSAVYSASLSPDGRTLATGYKDGTVIVWDVKQRRAIETLEGHGAVVADFGAGTTGADTVYAQSFSPDGRTLYTAGADGSAIIWDVAGNGRLGRPFPTGFVQEPGPSNAHFPPGFALSPDGRTLAVARLDGRVDRIDAETLRRTGRFDAFHPTPAIATEYAPDGRRLAVAGGHGVVGLWDAGSGERVGPLLRASPRRGPSCKTDPRTNSDAPLRCESIVQALAVGKEGLLAAAGLGGVVRIWGLPSRELIRPPLRVPPGVLGMAFSPDGSQLAITTGLFSAEPEVQVRDPRTGELLARLPTENAVGSVAFSPDGSLLAGGQVDGSTTLWATDGWRQVGRPLALSARPALGVAFSPDGRTLAVSHDNGAVVLWDVDSQQPIGSPLPGPPGQWATARFTPDGSRLFAVYENGTAIRWEVDPATWRRQACVVAGGDLTPEQWERIVPEQDYRSVCPSD